MALAILCEVIEEFRLNCQTFLLAGGDERVHRTCGRPAALIHDREMTVFNALR